MSELYIGLMSGTSLDGMDAVLVDFTQTPLCAMATHFEPMPHDLQTAILALCQPGENEINRLGELDIRLGHYFATGVNTLLIKSGVSPAHVHAIGSHGQTIRHAPNRFTLQIGDPNVIASHTGITTIADFRRRDVALGGQGAPLVPAFHQDLFLDAHVPRIIVNIGGIANITVLIPGKKSLGFDTGPGNTLLDAWTHQHLKQSCDQHGQWASSGTLDTSLLKRLLNDPYFYLSAPKSTGREYFNLSWLNAYLPNAYNPVNIQTTLVELTAQSILNALQQYTTQGEIYVCGGGVHNDYLMERIRYLANGFKVESTEKLGVHPDFVEAMAFAWLAKQTLDKKPGNLMAVTGAKKATILGGVYYT